MSESPQMRIMLATDLSARCDRALDRAIRLAASLQAELVVAHAIEMRGEDLLPESAAPFRETAETRQRSAHEQILEDIGGASIAFSVAIEEGDSATVALRVAEERDVQLIVTGIARYEPWGRMLLGSTVDSLVRRSSVPVLVVKRRARSDYERIAVAVDLSQESLRALETAVRLFDRAHITAFHANEPSLASLADRQTPGRTWEDIANKECDAFLNKAQIAASQRSRISVLVETGDPVAVLRNYAATQPVDLIVLGARRGRSALMQVFFGGGTEALINSAPCDVLVVPV
jgi:nucleotide-binding universal stress UspA family protein